MSRTQIQHCEDVQLSVLPPNDQFLADQHAAPLEQPSRSSEPAPLTSDTALKLMSCGLSFFCAGINDGSLGTLIPYFRQSYGISLGAVTIIYGVSFAGWCISGFTNGLVLQYLPLGAILVLGASLQLLSQCLRFWRPPFALFCVSFLSTAAGQGYQDSHSNTFVSSVSGAHRWLGFIHAMYAMGLLVAPFVANSIAVQGDETRWSYYYLFPSGLGVLNVVSASLAFRDVLRRRRKPDTSRRQDMNVVQRTDGVDSEDTRSGRLTSALQDSFKTIQVRGVWQLSVWYFFYLGAVFTIGGWIVQYLVTVRHGALSQMGYVPTALNGGTFLGRIVLAEPTHRLGERRMIAVYSGLWMVFQLIFWLVPHLSVDIAMVALMGFFTGPFFATGISVGSKLFKTEQKASALGFVFIAAQAGGALFPTLTGLIADSAGVEVLQPIVVALIAATLASWFLIPKKGVESAE